MPILGVCLGHQAIGVAFGAKVSPSPTDRQAACSRQIVNTPSITHGHVVPVSPVQPPIGLFASRVWKLLQGGENDFDVVVYNSLTVDPESETFNLFRAELMYRSTGGASNHRMVRTATW